MERKPLKWIVPALAALLLVSPLRAADWYVSEGTGSNRNDGSKTAPFRNIQKAVNAASPGDVIRVAEGNYYGLLDCGNIKVNKPVSIIGGYASDFSKRDVLKYRTFIQPTATSNGSAQGQGTIQIDVRESGTLVELDGLIMDRGNSVAYSAKEDGKPEGVETPLMCPIGTGGTGVLQEKVYTTETAIVYISTGAKCDVTIRNCAFLNGPYYGLVGSTFGAAVTIDNCIFVNIRMAAVELRGASTSSSSTTRFTNNTVLFTWSRLKNFDDMGYGFRCMPRSDSSLDHDIFGCCISSALDRSGGEASCTNTLFFLNGEASPDGTGNREADPSVFGDRIVAAYLNGFTAATRGSAKGTMFANHYPVEEALKLFGAVPGYGAQLPE